MTRSKGKIVPGVGHPRVFNDPNGWKADFERSVHLNSTWDVLMSKGCRPRPLLALLIPCVCAGWESGRRKKDLDEIKKRCDGLIRRLESVASEGESLGKMRLKHMDGMALSTSLALPVSLGLALGLDPPHDFFVAWPASVRAHAARLRRLKQTLAERWSPKQNSAAQYVYMLYLYCLEATAGKATYRHVAELLNAGWEASGIHSTVTEDVVRMQVRRLKRPQTASLLQALETFMKVYIAEYPNGDLSFTEWSLTRKLAFPNSSPDTTQDPYELLARESARRARLLEPATNPPGSPEALEADLMSFISTLRSIYG
jgi:hypothetical protein